MNGGPRKKVFKTVLITVIVSQMTVFSCIYEESAEPSATHIVRSLEHDEGALTGPQILKVKNWAGRVHTDGSILDALTVAFMAQWADQNSNAGPIPIVKAGLNFRERLEARLGAPTYVDKKDANVWRAILTEISSMAASAKHPAAQAASGLLKGLSVGIEYAANSTDIDQWARNLSLMDFRLNHSSPATMSNNLFADLLWAGSEGLRAKNMGDPALAHALDVYSWRGSNIGCALTGGQENCVKGEYATLHNTFKILSKTLNIEKIVTKISNNQELTLDEIQQLKQVFHQKMEEFIGNQEKTIALVGEIMAEVNQVARGVEYNGKKLDKLDKDLTSLFEYFVEEKYLEIASRANQAIGEIEFDAAQNTIHTLGQLVSFVDKDAGQAIAVVGSAGLEISQMVAKYSGHLAAIKQAEGLKLLKDAFSAANALATVAMFGQLVSIGMNVLQMFSDEKTIEQEILDQIYKLSEQIDELGEHLDTRFNYVDNRLRDLHVAILTQFEYMSEEHQRTQEEIDSVKNVLSQIQGQLDRMHLSLAQAARERYLGDFDYHVDNSLNWDENYDFLIPKSSWLSAEQEFYTTAYTRALGSNFAGDMDDLAQYEDIDVADELKSRDINLSINYLNQYPAKADDIRGNYLVEGSRYIEGQMRIANAALWLRAAGAYALLAEQNPDYSKLVNTSKFENVMDRGRELVTAFENMGHETLFNNLLDKYEDIWLDLEDAVATKALDLQSGKSRAGNYSLDELNIFDDNVQTLQNAKVMLRSRLSDDRNRIPQTTVSDFHENELLNYLLRISFIRTLLLADHMNLVSEVHNKNFELGLKVIVEKGSMPWVREPTTKLWECSDGILYTLEIRAGELLIATAVKGLNESLYSEERPTGRCPADVSRDRFDSMRMTTTSHFPGVTTRARQKTKQELSDNRKKFYEEIATAFKDPDLTKDIPKAVKKLNGIKGLMQLYAERGLARILVRSEGIRGALYGPNLRDGDAVGQIVDEIVEAHKILTDWQNGGDDPFAGVSSRPDVIDPRSHDVTRDIFNPEFIATFRAQLNNWFENLEFPYANTLDIRMTLEHLDSVRTCDPDETRVSLDVCPDGEHGYAKYRCQDRAWKYLECVDDVDGMGHLRQIRELFLSLFERLPTDEEILDMRIIYKYERLAAVVNFESFRDKLEAYFAERAGRSMKSAEFAEAKRLFIEDGLSFAEYRKRPISCPGSCNDSNLCTTDRCDTNTGQCVNAPRTGLCGLNGVCSNGTCFIEKELGFAECSDGKDNDSDGLIDCLDYDCMLYFHCGVATKNENTNSTCSDGRDNDGDGYVDCNDPSCYNSSKVTVCRWHFQPVEPVFSM